MTYYYQKRNSGVANKLMESYLRNRYQRVVINVHNNSNGYFSKWEEVLCRVPQGSVLGPLFLFNTCQWSF